MNHASGELISNYSGFGLEEKIEVIPFPEHTNQLKHLIYLRHEHNYYQ
jgi:hypothetical protein